MANNRIAYGLCKRYGIPLPKDATPADAWKALKEKGITSDMVYDNSKPGTEKQALQDKTIDELKHEAMVNVGLHFFAKPPSFDPDEVRRNVPKEALSFARVDTKHHESHMREMGYKNHPEYVKGAIEFWNSEKGKVYYNPYNSRYIRYDDKSRRMVSIDSDGIIHTFMIVGTSRWLERTIQQEALYAL